MRVCVFVLACVFVCECVSACMCACVRLCVCVCVSACVCVCVCVCVYCMLVDATNAFNILNKNKSALLNIQRNPVTFHSQQRGSSPAGR